MKKILFYHTSHNHETILKGIDPEVECVKANDFAEKDIEDKIKFKIKEFLDSNFNSDDSYLIFIPTKLDLNDFNAYKGVDLALWIYMYFVENERTDFRITLLGPEYEAAFLKHCKYANILMAPNVNYVQALKDEINDFNSKIESIKTYDKDELVEALKKVNVRPPAAHKTAHTTINEWSIYRWSKALGLPDYDKSLDRSLYFNYLRTTISIKRIYDGSLKKSCKTKNKVLVIDDEIDKGWKAFFESLLDKDKVRCIGSGFDKIKSKESLIAQATKEVEGYDPGIVILDLRLHESDHGRGADPGDKGPEKLSGIKILENIKRLNRGIQVIGFTASNKVWNLLEWQRYGIDGFILKESPENSAQTQIGYTEKSIERLVAAISEADDKAGFLKEICRKNKETKNLIGEIKNNANKNKKNNKEGEGEGEGEEEEYSKPEKILEVVRNYIRLAEEALCTARPLNEKDKSDNDNKNSDIKRNRVNYDSAFTYYFLIAETMVNLIIDTDNVNEYYLFRGYDNLFLSFYNPLDFKKSDSKVNRKNFKYLQKFLNIRDFLEIDYDSKEIDKLIKVRNGFHHTEDKDGKNAVGQISRENVIGINSFVCELIKNYKR